MENIFLFLEKAKSIYPTIILTMIGFFFRLLENHEKTKTLNPHDYLDGTLEIPYHYISEIGFYMAIIIFTIFISINIFARMTR
jgi:hypothetical protein